MDEWPLRRRTSYQLAERVVMAERFRAVLPHFDGLSWRERLALLEYDERCITVVRDSAHRNPRA